MEVVEQALAEQSIPLPPALETGGIVGAVTITDCITDSDSPWFDGPFGFVLTNAKTLTFKPLRGRLGLFETSLELSDF